jgi:hypothetical protein
MAYSSAYAPSPCRRADRERGDEGGGEGRNPTAGAVGCRTSPLPGLENDRPTRHDLMSELLTRDTTCPETGYLRTMRRAPILWFASFP